MVGRDQERYVIACREEIHSHVVRLVNVTRNGFPSKNEEVVGSLTHESSEFVAEDFLDLIRLLDGY